MNSKEMQYAYITETNKRIFSGQSKRRSIAYILLASNLKTSI